MAREELLQLLIERMGSVMRSLHTGQGFPFGEFTLNMPQVRMLFLVASKKQGASVKELAEMLNVTPGAVTQFLDALVAKGLVRRGEDPNDRRMLRIKLTELAGSKFEGFKTDYFVSASRVFDTLNEEEIGQLIKLLAKINIPAGLKDVENEIEPK